MAWKIIPSSKQFHFDLLDPGVDYRPYGEFMIKIGTVAERSGVGIDTLRFYETRKLIRPDARTNSGYRLYDPDSVFERLSFIKKAQSVGFSLDEIARIIEEVAHDRRPCVEVRRMARQILDALEKRIADLEHCRDELRETVNAWDAKGEAEGHICGLIESLAPKFTKETGDALALPLRRTKRRKS